MVSEIGDRNGSPLGMVADAGWIWNSPFSLALGSRHNLQLPAFLSAANGPLIPLILEIARGVDMRSGQVSPHSKLPPNSPGECGFSKLAMCGVLCEGHGCVLVGWVCFIGESGPWWLESGVIIAWRHTRIWHWTLDIVGEFGAQLSWEVL